MKTIITIQHTQAVHHDTGMVGSWTDWELTDLGKKHAENIGRKLAAELNQTGLSYKLYSSDLLRAKQTIDPLARYMGLDVEYRMDLREHNIGEACGKSGQWARDNSAPCATFDDRAFPSAESWREFWNRINGVIESITADENENENIILASHGVTLSVWQQIWNGEDIQDFRYLGLPGGVSVFTIDKNGVRKAERINDGSYME